MSDQRKRRVENVRLVRLPDGRLVRQDQAPQIQSEHVDVEASPLTHTPEILHEERRLKKTQKLTEKKLKKEARQKDILQVWHEQKQIKQETERIELEYEVAKKIARDLKRKIKERNQPYEGEGIDDAFKELLSPEMKSVARKIRPHISSVKSKAKQSAASGLLTGKKISKFTVILAKRVTKDKKLTALTLAGLVVVVSCGVALSNFRKHRTVSVTDVKGSNTQPSIALNQKPEFAVLTPAGKKIEEIGGFAKVSPQGSAAAYAFKDSIGDISIKVSQQQMPDIFKSNPIELENLAKKYNATKTVQVDATTVYIGKSGKGPQTAIFTKEGLLVFVVADSEVPDVGWVQYVTNLIKI